MALQEMSDIKATESIHIGDDYVCLYAYQLSPVAIIVL